LQRTRIAAALFIFVTKGGCNALLQCTLLGRSGGTSRCIEGRLPIARNVQAQLAIRRDDRLRTDCHFHDCRSSFALLGFRLQVVRQLRRQHALGELMLELPGQPRLAENRLGIFALHLSQQLIYQFIRKKASARSVSCSSWSCLLFVVWVMTPGAIHAPLTPQTR
jgi:hypothetical protein